MAKLPSKPIYKLTKRLFDLLAAAVGLLVLAPLLAVLYAAIAMINAGGALFIQKRGGRNGRLFDLVKFRTMRPEHVHDPDPSVRIADQDAGVTRLGRFIRKLKLDELPQLWNVLRGDMSLVGPRPTVPEQVAAYNDFQRQRLLVIPGMTGLAQINGGTALSWDERIEWDVYYVYHRSWRMDLAILLATFLAVLRGTEERVRRFDQVHPGEQLPGR
jgi:lipopolysaccharide/colanic/teichoic acid biosynthesis glycosyltransferase